MGSLQFTNVQTYPTAGLEMTSLTVDEVRPWGSSGEAAFQAPSSSP
jgi:hypothetical protein